MTGGHPPPKPPPPNARHRPPPLNPGPTARRAGRPPITGGAPQSLTVLWGGGLKKKVKTPKGLQGGGANAAKPPAPPPSARDRPPVKGGAPQTSLRGGGFKGASDNPPTPGAKTPRLSLVREGSAAGTAESGGGSATLVRLSLPAIPGLGAAKSSRGSGELAENTRAVCCALGWAYVTCWGWQCYNCRWNRRGVAGSLWFLL